MRTMDFGFPPFTRAVKILVYVNLAIFVLMFIFDQGAPNFSFAVNRLFGLLPVAVVHGWVWQLVTYAFLHGNVLHILFNMLSLWMFGSRLEIDWGRQKFLEFYFFCVIGAALTTVALTYTHVLGMSPNVTTIGASGGIYGLLVAFGILYAEARVYIYGIFAIKAKIFAAIWVALALFGAVGGRGDVNHIAHLGGALFGYIYVKAMPRRGIRYAASEGYFGLLNRYHRWKRRQAAKKFDVYMRDHDRNKYFDEHGNYRDPQSRDRENGEGKGGGWVN